jgi:general secretion pathway protein G
MQVTADKDFWKESDMLHKLQARKDEGFTLIELLIVVIILGILAAIVVFAIGSTRKDSVASTCRTDVKSIILAEEAWNTKNGAYTTNQSDLTSATGTLKNWPTDGAAATDSLKLTLAAGPVIHVEGKNITAADVTLTDTDKQIADKCTPSS